MQRHLYPGQMREKRLGGYLESLPDAGDLEMWLRFAAHGPLAWVPRFSRLPAVSTPRTCGSADAEAEASPARAGFRGDRRYARRCARGPTGRPRQGRWSALAVEAVKAAGARLADGDCAGAERGLTGLACEFDPTVVRHPRWVLHIEAGGRR